MPSISNLNENEKLFLAGCLKTVIMADGKFEAEELSDLDSILEVYNFPDYENYLEKFESEIKDEEAFWNLAETMDDNSVKDQIISIMMELSVQEGYQDKTAALFISKLKKSWKMEE